MLAWPSSTLWHNFFPFLYKWKLNWIYFSVKTLHSPFFLKKLTNKIIHFSIHTVWVCMCGYECEWIWVHEYRLLQLFILNCPYLFFRLNSFLWFHGCIQLLCHLIVLKKLWVMIGQWLTDLKMSVVKDDICISSKVYFMY